MLDDSDKQWILHALATELNRFSTKQDLEQFATKADLERFATKADLDQFASKEDLERVETRLLTEFHRWASPTRKRISGLIQAMSAHDEEIGDIRQRLATLEQRMKGLTPL